VLLLDNVTDCTLKTNSPVGIVTADSNPHTQPPYSRSGPFATSTRLALSAGNITIAGESFGAAEVTVSPDRPHIFSLNGNEYRGKLRLIVNPDGRSFDVINLVPLEPYLAGVVGAEMPDYWEPEALDAQAIVARTYCLYIKNRFGRNREWDLNKTQASQVYLGVKGESAQIWSAVSRTSGQVLLCEHVGRSKDLFPTYYSSVCGGHTEASSNVFGDSFGPLVGVACPYCKDVAKLSLFYWPMAKFNATAVTAALHNKYPKLKPLGEITRILPAEKSDYGGFSRLTKVKLFGSTGKSDVLRAEDLRLTIDPTGRRLKSAICHIVKWGQQWAFVSGRGWGHGVGMCQHGAEGMARKGKTAEQILAHYYPGSWIERVY
jgi:stage II sporulation protein D